MKSLKEHLYNKETNNILLTEVCNVIVEDMINESFKLPILKKLADKIKDWESRTHAQDVKNIQKAKEEGRSWLPTPSAQTFASIFGPIVKKTKYGDDKTRVRGCAWDQLTDDNVTYYEGGWDSALHKKIKKLWSAKIRGLVIACDPDTHDIKYVIRGFTSTDVNGRLLKPVTYDFALSKGLSGDWKSIRQVTAKSHKYSSRNVNAEEACETINDYEVYFIEIPESMIQEYDTLVADRKKAQKGVVNYDEASLKELARLQRIHYKSLAKELRAKRLAENPEYLFNDITKLNDRVLKLYQKISGNYEYAEKFYSIGDLMTYVGRIFEDYFRYMRDMYRANMSVKHAKEQGRENAESAGGYYRSNAANYLEGCKKDIDKVNKNIDEIEKSMSA